MNDKHKMGTSRLEVSKSRPTGSLRANLREKLELNETILVAWGYSVAEPCRPRNTNDSLRRTAKGVIHLVLRKAVRLGCLAEFFLFNYAVVTIGGSSDARIEAIPHVKHTDYVARHRLEGGRGRNLQDLCPAF